MYHRLWQVWSVPSRSDRQTSKQAISAGECWANVTTWFWGSTWRRGSYGPGPLNWGRNNTVGRREENKGTYMETLKNLQEAKYRFTRAFGKGRESKWSEGGKGIRFEGLWITPSILASVLKAMENSDAVLCRVTGMICILETRYFKIPKRTVNINFLAFNPHFL